jgi:hypothetical protein
MLEFEYPFQTYSRAPLGKSTTDQVPFSLIEVNSSDMAARHFLLFRASSTEIGSSQMAARSSSVSCLSANPGAYVGPRISSMALSFSGTSSVSMSRFGEEADGDPCSTAPGAFGTGDVRGSDLRVGIAALLDVDRAGELNVGTTGVAPDQVVSMPAPAVTYSK